MWATRYLIKMLMKYTHKNIFDYTAKLKGTNMKKMNAKNILIILFEYCNRNFLFYATLIF